MQPRIIFLHGNDTLHWSGSWCGWLKQELDKAGYQTFFETFPDSINARAVYWLEFLKNHVHAGPNDVLVGWSSGAVAAMKYAETNQILGSVLIGPSVTDLGDTLEKQSGYYDTPWQWDAINQNQSKIALFYSDDDPYIPQAEFEEVAKQLAPEVHKLSGHQHFIGEPTFPELLAYLVQTYK